MKNYALRKNNDDINGLFPGTEEELVGRTQGRVPGTNSIRKDLKAAKKTDFENLIVSRKYSSVYF